MILSKKFASLLTFAFIFTGCAHQTMRGSVAMKTSESDAHVCLGEGEVKVGDKVTLFRNECTKRPTGAKIVSRPNVETFCEKRELGHGTVQQILNKHYSLVKFDPGVQFEEGTFVEKY